jgi:uncharacterized protein YpuA (DUF1002 family)
LKKNTRGSLTAGMISAVLLPALLLSSVPCTASDAAEKPGGAVCALGELSSSAEDTAASQSSGDTAAAVATSSGENDPAAADTDSSDTAGLIDKFLEGLKQKSDSGQLETDDQLRSAIDESAKTIGIEISDEQKEQILQAFNELRGMGLSTDQIIEEAQKFLRQYGAGDISDLGSTIEKAIRSQLQQTAKDTGKKIGDSLKQMIQQALQNLGESILSQIRELFSKWLG